MAQPMISLLSYLQVGLPQLPVDGTGQSTNNTTNAAYHAGDIKGVGRWEGFNIEKLLEKHMSTLIHSGIQYDPFPTSPQPLVTREKALTARSEFLVTPRVRRALRSGFSYLQRPGHALGRREAVITFGDGSFAITPQGFVPDLAYVNVDENHRTRANRTPGDLKLSFKWSSSWINSGIPTRRVQYKQVLSQVNFYMKQHQAKYGLICTDTEMVAIKRLDDDGHLLLSDPIAWTTAGSANQPVMTVLMALWWIGMIVSDGRKWKLRS